MAYGTDRAHYTVGWIAPMALELTAGIAVADKLENSIWDRKDGTLNVPGDDTIYTLGRIGDHYVAMAVCPRIGTHSAATVAADMRRSFPNIKHILVVGIAGGVPRYGVNLVEQIVLGDVVVSVPQYSEGGVTHIESGAWEGKDKLNVSGHMLHPSQALLGAVINLRSRHMQKPGTRIPQFLRELRERLEEHELPEFKDPGPENDHLYDDDYLHLYGDGLCEGLCDEKRSKLRNERGAKAWRKEDTPFIHYGTIGSSNALVISGAKRNELYEKHRAICFEMESAGVMNDVQCLVIRGICDYADSHKNKKWQKYAAATAAACAKEIL
ncbi:purine and uridine phosphorylase, partial [Lepidopterella palustris CBS 459.81]